MAVTDPVSIFIIMDLAEGGELFYMARRRYASGSAVLYRRSGVSLEHMWYTVWYIEISSQRTCY